MGSRTTLGDALHAAGELDAAQAAFRAAETLQAENQPEYSKLYSLPGYQFCDLLLSRSASLDGSALGRDALASVTEDVRARCEEVRERATQTLEWAIQNQASLLSIALDHLSLGRATLGLALATVGGLNDAVEPLNAAVHGLRAASVEHHIPRGLIARATLHRFRDDVAAAEADLEEALDIAERGSMRLHECDAHLEWARLRLSVEDIEEARRQLDAARALVVSTGYRRREREVAELTRALVESG